MQADIARSREQQDDMWAVFSPVVDSGHSPDLMSSLGESLTEIVNVDETRVTSGLYARVPETVVLLLLVCLALSLGMVGYRERASRAIAAS